MGENEFNNRSAEIPDFNPEFIEIIYYAGKVMLGVNGSDAQDNAIYMRLDPSNRWDTGKIHEIMFSSDSMAALAESDNLEITADILKFFAAIADEGTRNQLFNLYRSVMRDENDPPDPTVENYITEIDQAQRIAALPSLPAPMRHPPYGRRERIVERQRYHRAKHYVPK